MAPLVQAPWSDTSNHHLMRRRRPQVGLWWPWLDFQSLLGVWRVLEKRSQKVAFRPYHFDKYFEFWNREKKRHSFCIYLRGEMLEESGKSCHTTLVHPAPARCRDLRPSCCRDHGASAPVPGTPQILLGRKLGSHGKACSPGWPHTPWV